ncbi:CHAT domain-containing protein, partial [bacterium]|nr:CHAT domain-containing protein [bacterium]
DKASIYITLKQHNLARKTYEEALEIANLHRLQYYEKKATALLGNVWFSEKSFFNARKSFREFLDFIDSQKNSRESAYLWQGKIAHSYLLEKNYVKAKEFYLEALKEAKQSRSKLFEGWYLVRMGDLEQQLGNSEAAIDSYDLARQIALDKESPSMLWEIYFGLGRTYQEIGELGSAIAHYRQAVSIIEQTRDELQVSSLQIGYFSEPSAVCQNLVNCYWQLYEQSKPQALDSLFYFYKMGHARVLAEQGTRKGVFSPDQEYLQSEAQLRIIQRRLRQKGQSLTDTDHWNGLLMQLDLARYSLRAQRLRIAAADTNNQKNPQPPLQSITDLLEQLSQADLGLLLYHITEDLSFALVGSGQKVELVKLDVRPAYIESAIDSLMSPFHNVAADLVDNTVFHAATANRLYDALVKPVEEAVSLPKRMVIVPDFALMNLPFELLLTRRPEKPAYLPSDYPDYADAFLAHRYEITYSPTPALLKPDAITRSTDPSLLIVANAAGEGASSELASSFRSMSWQFDALRYAKKEAVEIDDIHPDSRILEHEQATKESLMAYLPHYQALHFATHAFADTVSDDFSGLVLTAGSDSTDNGILLGYEIPSLPLQNCDLVTLSACETARGALIKGEGVLSLPRQFLLAGAKTVVMTHWKVDDRFASDLMPSFYRNYIKNGLSKAGALSKAKRNVLSQVSKGKKGYYQHPFFWAAFTIYGDPGTERESGASIYWLILILLLATAVVALTVRFRIARGKAST